MNKKVLIVNYDQNSESTEELIKSVLRKGDLPMFAISLRSSFTSKMAERLLYTNRVLVEMCSIIYVNCQGYVSPGFITDIIGYAKLFNKEIVINNGETKQ